MFKKISTISLIVLIVSGCGQRMSKKRTPNPKPVQEELRNSPVYVLEEELKAIGSETRSVKMPSVGEELMYEVTHAAPRVLRFKKIEGNTSFICEFNYRKAKVKEVIKTVEDKSYSIEKTIIASEPVFTGAPIQDWEQKCRKDVEEGKYKFTYSFLISEQLVKFKSFVRSNFIDKYNKCLKRVRPTYYTCKDEGIEIDRVNSELMDYFRMVFIGRLKGKDLKIDASINFDRIYFSNFGLLKLELVGTDPINFSTINSIKTLNWKL